MDHETAVQLGAPERYVTGDLSSLERDAFEEHFADCRPCMNDVWTASAFAANAKAVFEDRLAWKPAPRPTGWRSWLQLQTAVPAFAAVVLAVVAGYQARVTIPAMTAPAVMSAAVPLDDAQRSGLRSVEEGAPLHFEIAVSQQPGAARFWVELADATGKVLSAGSVPAPPPGEPLAVYFPVKPGPGQFSILVRAGKAGPQLAQRDFEVQPRTH